MKISLFLKFFFSFFALAFLFARIDYEEFFSAFDRVDFAYWFFALVLAVFSIFLSCYKWKSLLVVEGISPSILYLFNLYTVGFFFNNFLPTSIGGDGARVYYLSRRYGLKLAGVSSVLVERIAGLFAVLGIAFVGFIFFAPIVGFEYSLGICFFSVLIFAMLSSFIVWGFFVKNKWFNNKLFVFFRNIDKSVRLYCRVPGVCWTLIWTSVVYQLFMVSIYFLVSLGFEFDVTFFDFLFVVPVVTLITLFPLSINGFGVREGGLVYLLSKYGVVASDAFAFSLLIYALSLPFSLYGALYLSRVRGREPL